MNNWNELSVKVSRETEEAVSNMLIEAGAQGVAIEDTQDYLNNVDHFGEILPDVVQLDTIIIKAYYPENISIIELSQQVRAQIAGLLDFGLQPGAFTVSLALLHADDQRVPAGAPRQLERVAALVGRHGIDRPVGGAQQHTAAYIGVVGEQLGDEHAAQAVADQEELAGVHLGLPAQPVDHRLGVGDPIV